MHLHKSWNVLGGEGLMHFSFIYSIIQTDMHTCALYTQCNIWTDMHVYVLTCAPAI